MRTKKNRKSQKNGKEQKKNRLLHPVSLFLLILMIGVAAYAPELKGNFIFDDGFYVQHNPNLKNFSTLIHWHQFRHNRPLYWFSFFVGKTLWGNNPAGYKAVNLIFHILAAYILFFFLLHLLELKGIYDRWFAFTVSLLFLLSPLATEAVSYISGRNNGIGGFFFILGCFLYLKTLDPATRKKKILFFIASVASFLAAFLFKEIYIVFVLFYPLLYLFIRPVTRKSVFLLFGGIILLALITLALSFTVPMSPFAQIRGVLAKSGPHINSRPLATNTVAVAYSLRLFAFPDRLNIDHDLPVLNSLASPKAILAALFLIGIGLLLFRLRKKLPLSFPAYIAYILLIAPTNSFILRHGQWMIDPLSERNLYACAIFFSIILAEVLTVSIQKEKTRRVVFTIILLAYAGRTFTRNMDFSNNISLWQASVRYSPDRARPNYNLAVALKNGGKIREAIPYARKALEISPESQCYGLLASLLTREGKVEKAKETLLDGIRNTEKNRAILYNQLGQLLYSKGEFRQAESYLLQALRENPRLIQANLTLMMIQLENGEFIAAQKTIQKIQWHIRKQSRTFRSKQIINNDTKAMLAFGRGLLYFKTGHPKAGASSCEKAVELNPDFTEPLIRLGEYFYKEKDYPKSWKYFLKAAGTTGFKRYSAAAGPYMRNLKKLLDNPNLNPGL